MKVQLEMSMEQEELVAEHLLKDSPLFVTEAEKARLARFVRHRYPGHRIVGAQMDLENARWSIELSPVTVTP